MKADPKSFIFVYGDIAEFEATTKQMTFTSLAEANVLHLRSLTTQAVGSFAFCITRLGRAQNVFAFEIQV